MLSDGLGQVSRRKDKFLPVSFFHHTFTSQMFQNVLRGPDKDVDTLYILKGKDGKKFAFVCLFVKIKGTHFNRISKAQYKSSYLLV